MASCSSPSFGSIVEERVSRLLLDAGVDASEMDPLSLETLCELFVVEQQQQQQQQQQQTAGTVQPMGTPFSYSDSPSSSSFVVPSSTKPKELPRKVGFQHTLIQRRFSDLTEAAAAAPQPFASSMDNTNRLGVVVDSSSFDTAATTAGGGEGGEGDLTVSMEERLLKRLEEQSRLILDLHRRMDELGSIVYNLQVQQQQQQQGLGGAGAATVSPPPLAWPRRVVLPPSFTAAGGRGGGGGGGPRFPPVARTNNDNLPQEIPQHQAQVHPPRQHQPDAPVVPNNNNNLLVLPFLGSVVQWFMVDLPNGIRNSRLCKIGKLFLELRRRQVPDFDLALLLKILILLAILVARLNNSSNYARSYREQQQQQQRNLGKDSSSTSIADAMKFLWMYRFYLLVVFVVAGFFMQSGYAHFLYNFFVKEDYPGRIWNGEEITVDTIAAAEQQQQQQLRQQQQQQQQQRPLPEAPRLHPRQPQQQEAAGGGEGGGGGWREAILGGHIPRRVVVADPDPNRPQQLEQQQQQLIAGQLMAPVRVAIEVGLLLGSFVLSIFPMWQPQAAALPVQQQRDNHNNDEDPNNHGNDDSSNNNNNDQLPRVRPPRDPAEYEEEEDDDDFEEREE